MSFSTKCATVQTCPGHDKPMQKEFQNKISKTKWASANRPEQSEYQPIWGITTLENLISVLTRTTLHYKIPPQHGLIGYLHAQCHPRRGAPRLPKFFENVPNFKLFTVPKLKTNQIVFCNQKSILFQKWGICCIFPQNAPWYRSNGKSTWTRLLATYTMPCHSGIPLEHAY